MDSLVDPWALSQGTVRAAQGRKTGLVGRTPGSWGPLWGRTPSSRCRNNDIGILQGTSRPTGASAADPGVRPTQPAGLTMAPGFSRSFVGRRPIPTATGDIRC